MASPPVEPTVAWLAERHEIREAVIDLAAVDVVNNERPVWADAATAISTAMPVAQHHLALAPSREAWCVWIPPDAPTPQRVRCSAESWIRLTAALRRQFRLRGHAHRASWGRECLRRAGRGACMAVLLRRVAADAASRSRPLRLRLARDGAVSPQADLGWLDRFRLPAYRADERCPASPVRVRAAGMRPAPHGIASHPAERVRSSPLMRRRLVNGGPASLAMEICW